MIISAAISFEDWMDAFGTWGKVGVYRIFRHLKDNGVTRVYWRTMGGGVVTYPSSFEDTIRTFWTDQGYEQDHLLDGNIPESRIIDKIYDMRDFDAVACARNVAKIFDIEFYLWHEPHQECHGWHQFSNFVRKHPELCPVNCYGERLPGHLSWGFEEAIQRRMDLFKEVLVYEPDGIVLDFVKGGDHIYPRIDGKGYSAIGYEKPILDAFKKKTGKDAKTIPNDDMEWIKFRAGYVTDFVRRAREYQNKWYPGIVFGVFGVHKGRGMGAYQDEVPGKIIRDKSPLGAKDGTSTRKKVTIGMVGPLEGNLEDHETWIAGGLIDTLVADVSELLTLPDGKLDSEEYGQRIDQARSLVKGNCLFGSQLNTWSSNEEQMLESARVASEHGCQEVVLWEYVGAARNKTFEAVKKITDKYGKKRR